VTTTAADADHKIDTYSSAPAVQVTATNYGALLLEEECDMFASEAERIDVTKNVLGCTEFCRLKRDPAGSTTIKTAVYPTAPTATQDFFCAHYIKNKNTLHSDKETPKFKTHCKNKS